ncbi:MAG: glycosyltransferase family 2 protein, partial [Pseudomonas sp.]
AQNGVATPAGTVMLSALPMLMGLQLIMAFLGYDIASVPSRPRHSRRGRATSLREENSLKH